MKESFKLVLQLADERIRPYLSERWIQSPIFQEALAYTVAHFKQHGDSRLMAQLFEIYSRPAARRLLTEYFRIHAGLHAKLEEGMVKFTKAGEAERVAFPVRPTPKNTPKVEAVVKKKRRSPKRVDVMAPWIRLPGSYDHGKRR